MAASSGGPRLRAPRVPLLAVAVACLAATLASCSGHYVVEDRDTPVHVWLEAPAAMQADVATHLLIYVGDRKVMDGPIRFPAGQPRIELPTAYMPGGDKTVSVVVGGGRVAAQGTVKIRHATWILVTVRGASAEIGFSPKEPDSPK